MDIKSEQPITWIEVKKLLSDKAKDKELGYEQNIALEHLKKFAKTSQKATGEIIEKLVDIKRLNSTHKTAIANFLPEDLDDLRVLFSNEKLDLSAEEKKKIIDIVKAATK